MLRILDGLIIAKEDLGSVPISFTETVNTPTEAGCSAATHIPSTAPCSDFFLFPFGTFADLPFTYLGIDYNLSFGLVPGLGTIFEVVTAECDVANPGLDTCGRIRTAEASTNSIDITMTLTQLSVQTPAPASLILLGMALVGVGVAGRFRRNGRRV